MNKTLANTKSSELYRKIASLPLSPATRDEALGALQIAERLINGISRMSGVPKESLMLRTPKAA